MTVVLLELSHALEVSSLATSQTLVFDGFANANAALGAGSLAFSAGTWSGGSFTGNGTTNTVTIENGSDTLEAVAATINDAAIGVTASVVKKPSRITHWSCTPIQEKIMRYIWLRNQCRQRSRRPRLHKL